MRTIMIRENPEAAWKPYAQIISTRADAEKFARFIQKLTGCETRTEENDDTV